MRPVGSASAPVGPVVKLLAPLTSGARDPQTAQIVSGDDLRQNRLTDSAGLTARRLFKQTEDRQIA